MCRAGGGGRGTGPGRHGQGWRRPGPAGSGPRVAGGRMVSVIQSAATGSASARSPRALPPGRALCIFLTAGPAPGLRGGMAGVAHLAIARDRSPGSLTRVCGAVRAFSPTWAGPRLLLEGPGPPQLPVPSAAFPAVKVQRSVFHRCKHLHPLSQQLQQLQPLIQQLIQLLIQLLIQQLQQLQPQLQQLQPLIRQLQQLQPLALDARSKRRVLAVPSDAVRAASAPHRTHWVPHVKIWAAHSERTRGDSGDDFRDPETGTQGLSRVFSAGSLESCSTSLAQHYQKCVSKGPPDAAASSAPRPDHHTAWAAPWSPPASGPPLDPAACRGGPAQSSVQASRTAAAAAVAAPESPVVVLQSAPAAPQLPAALRHQPEPPQALLLQREPLSPQSSLEPASPAVRAEAGRPRRVRAAAPGRPLGIRILEDAHGVGLKGRSSCTCRFHRVWRLPCRHGLAPLNLEGKTLQPGVLSRQRQEGCGAQQDRADGLLEVLQSSWNKPSGKSLALAFLRAGVSRLLARCGAEGLERRYRALRELAEGWIGPRVERRACGRPARRSTGGSAPACASSPSFPRGSAREGRVGSFSGHRLARGSRGTGLGTPDRAGMDSQPLIELTGDVAGRQPRVLRRGRRRRKNA
ncbi:LOW QUALITY PROTEIN: zinc finger SWIM domain-containing protein 1-like [Rhynochetos jubatus]